MTRSVTVLQGVLCPLSLLMAGDAFVRFGPSIAESLAKWYFVAALAHAGLAFAVRRSSVPVLWVGLAVNAALVLLDFAAMRIMEIAFVTFVAHAGSVVLLWREARGAAA